MLRFWNALLTLMLCLALPLTVWAQAPIAVTLLWDHPGTGVDAFYLERRVGQSGAYTPVPLTIPGTARQITDMVPAGTIHCWRLLAGLLEFRSVPSNEVCHAVVQAPITLRVMQ